MNKIQLHDKHFQIYIPSHEILAKVKELAQKMRRWGLNLTFTGGVPESSKTEVESTSSR